MGTITGRIGGSTLGFDLRAGWDGTHLSGRIGGAFIGKDIRVTVDGGAVTGRVGGAIAGFDVTGSVGPERLDVRLGTDDAHVSVVGSQVTGTVAFRSHAEPVALMAGADRLSGQIGDMALRLDAVNVPPEVTVLAGMVAWYARRGMLAQADANAQS